MPALADPHDHLWFFLDDGYINHFVILPLWMETCDKNYFDAYEFVDILHA